MPKLTKKQYNQLHTIKCNIQRAYDYIQRPVVVGIAEEIKSPLGADYQIINEACLNSCLGAVKYIRPMNKSIGSDIAGLSMALSQIDEFITINQ